MASDMEDDVLEDDSLTALNDTWDEELDDDLLRSDEDDLTTRGVSSHLEFGAEAVHLAEEVREQPADDEDVLDVQINEPLGDAFQEDSFGEQESDECQKTETTATVIRLYSSDVRKNAVEALDAQRSRVKEVENPAGEGHGRNIGTQSSRPFPVQPDLGRISTVPAFPGQHMFVQQQAGSDSAGVSELPQRPLDLRETRPKRAALHPVSISTAQSVLYTQPQMCVYEPLSTDQIPPPPQPKAPTLIHPQPRNIHQSPVGSCEVRPLPRYPTFPSVQSQRGIRDRPAPSCMAVIRPRMISPVCPRDVSDAPVLARNTPFISTTRLRPVAMGMPGAASHRVSARAGWCARAAPEPTPTDKKQGQEVKKDFPSLLTPHLLSRPERDRGRQLPWERMECFFPDDDDDDDDEKEEGVPEWYWLCLEEQKRLREQIIKQKEDRRLLQARKRKHEFPPDPHLRVRFCSQKPPLPQFSSLLLEYPEPEIHTSTSRFHSHSQNRIVLPASESEHQLKVRVNFLTHAEDAARRHSDTKRRGTTWAGEVSGHAGINRGKRKRMMMKEDEDVAVSWTCPAQLSENSRVVTFTGPWTPHTLGELRPSLRRRGASVISAS
ncbi:hypothetical protein PHYPO_G00117520 [Pangasianodon hypophthalmus]|uniref:Uncharacterized protein n=1 Tax=Pangasianodon hypophthalmus TaxID=310915 RepID=A0A5N5KYC6_PANHP|nr:hypothetical protein PHYPO_G00117520 [Pangasianodon hypophthalmus]